MKNFEITPSSGPSINEALSTMNGILGMIHQLGRNDSELSSAQSLIQQVEEGILSPQNGILAMQALLDSKQVH